EIEAVIVEGGEEVQEDVEEEEEEGVLLQEEGCPAVIVEEVSSAQVEECYSAQVLVYDDETYLMQDVAEEQEVITEVSETGKRCPVTTWCVSTKPSKRQRLFSTWSPPEDCTMNATQVKRTPAPPPPCFAG
uniref:Transcription factor Elf N-terminal domain-containing protein n=1 Tax=Cyclopterus lumpus TaxID=8103 RepID=A0A8C2WYM8_CYCLU